MARDDACLIVAARLRMCGRGGPTARAAPVEDGLFVAKVEACSLDFCSIAQAHI